MTAIDRMIDLQHGTVSREIFVSPQFYRDELEKLFARAWLFIGHESQIPKPGDFFVSRMGEESVILCRDHAGAVHVFLNSCRHRGMKVCRYEQGNTSLFVCPYHSWSYTTDGRLQGVPLYRALYEGTLQREDWSLIEVAKLAVYKGTVWATWDPHAADFLTYLGDAVDHLDQVVDCRDGRPGGAEVIGVHKWVFPSNWKFAAENFLGDTYHNPSHRSVDMIGMGPSGQRGASSRRDNEYSGGQRFWVGFPQGHGMTGALMPEHTEYVSSYTQHPIVDEYFRHCFHERKRRLGEKARMLPLVGTIFPNASYHGRQPRGICVWHPHSPTETEGWRFFMVDADAPAEVKDVLRRYYMRYSGPAGMTEQDDMENWLYATARQQGHHRAALSVQLSGVDGGVHERPSDPRRRIVADHRPDAAQLLSCLRIVSERRIVGRAAGSLADPRGSRMMRPLVWYQLREEIEEFLYFEADLLDQRRFKEWLELLAEDLVYFMPMRRNVKFGQHAERENTRQGEGISWFDEDKWTLGKRVEQILTGVHYAEEPLSRVCHMVSNVRLLDVRPSVEDAQEATVGCRFLVYQNRVEYRELQLHRPAHR